MIVNTLLILSYTILIIVFFILGLIHFNWVFDGKWGLEQAIPTKENGDLVMKPRKIDSASVGIGLLLFGAFYLIKSGLLGFHLPLWANTYVSWIIPSIFLLRSIGEFKYVGFFKKIKHTAFGKADTKIFSPLTILIGALGIFVHLTR